jgi:hypothetical protein
VQGEPDTRQLLGFADETIIEKSKPPAAAAPAKKKAAAAPAAPAKPGIQIITDPPGAEVYINNEEHPEKTPCTISGIKPGSYDITLSADGYQFVQRTVKFDGKSTAAVKIRLERE